MNKKQHLRNILELNFAMLLVSTSGTLGRYIEMPVMVTIAYRALLAAVFLYVFCRLRNISFRIASKDRFKVILSGILMGVHWITYFYSLKLSNVAIGMLSIFTYPVITSFLEPLILKTKFQKMHLPLGALVLLGIYFLVPDFSFENTYLKAVGFGVFSAFCYALRNIISKREIGNYNGSMIMWYQLIVVGVMLSPIFFLMDTSEIITEWPATIMLALVTTAIGHTLFLMSFKKFSITTASIISSTQPVYGIIIGAVFLSEIPSWTTIIGGILILSSVVIESVRSYK